MVRCVARALLAVPFIADGIEAIRNTDRHVTLAKTALANCPVGSNLPDIDDDQLTWIVRAHGAVTVIAAVAMGTGKMPRFNGLVLAALTAPRLVTNEPFTAAKVIRPIRRSEFIRALGLTGGALAVAAIPAKDKPTPAEGS